MPKDLQDEIQRIELALSVRGMDDVLANLQIQSTLVSRITDAHRDDLEIQRIVKNIKDGK